MSERVDESQNYVHSLGTLQNCLWGSSAGALSYNHVSFSGSFSQQWMDWLISLSGCQMKFLCSDTHHWDTLCSFCIHGDHAYLLRDYPMTTKVLFVQGGTVMSVIEWCSQNSIEYIKACATNDVFDKCISTDGDSQRVKWIQEALSAHMWLGMVVKL